MKKILIALAGILWMVESALAMPLRVVTTTEDLAAIAREVGGSLVEIESLTRGSQDPHFIEARPSLMLKSSRADLFIQIGLGLEVGWAPALLVGARNPRIQIGSPGYLDVSLSIQPLEIPAGPVDRSEGDVHPFGNPHYWLDPENGAVIAREIAARLSALLPEQSETIESRLDDFIHRLNGGIVRWENQLRPFAGARIVTYHRSWSYFAGRFRLSVAGYIEPKPGIPPSPAHIRLLIERVKREKVKLIVVEPYFDRSIPDLVSRETGARVLVLPPSVGGEAGIRTYFDLFDHLTGRVAAALKEAE